MSEGVSLLLLATDWNRGDQSVLPEHSGREVPVELGVQGVTDDDLSVPSVRPC